MHSLGESSAPSEAACAAVERVIADRNPEHFLITECPHRLHIALPFSSLASMKPQRSPP